MKKMIRTTLFSLSFVVAFLFVGIQSVQAQFLNDQDAMAVLLDEIPAVHADFTNATMGSSTYMIAGRKLYYYRNMVEALHDGMSTEQAIDYCHDLLPELAGLALLATGNEAPAPAAALRKNLRTEVINLLTN